MLQQLHIHNYAIIDSIEINFSNDLNIITGETGAGKSILMGALSLILGDRADTTVLMDKGKKCFVEGSFKTKNISVKSFLQKNDLDYEEEILIRREISPNGKSRAFINDSPVTLNQLKQLSSLLVDLHQQFDTLELNNNDFQREVIDALAGNTKLIDEYRSVYKKYRSALKQLDLLKAEQSSANKEFDYHQFLFDELAEVNFSENEIELIEAELKVMNNAENIKSILSEIFFQLEGSEEPLIQQLKSIINKLQSLKNVYPEIDLISERLQSVSIEMKDISGEIGGLNDKVFYDAKKINELNDRMASGYSLFKKHNVSTTAQLIQIKDDLEKQLEKVTGMVDEINRIEIELQVFYKDAIKLSLIISDRRKKEVKSFTEKVNKLLHQVGMPNAEIKIEIRELEELNAFGNDSVEFLFNANRSSLFEPLRKVASGGELSRIMLIIKSLVAKSVQLPTLIFDEIDSGISGEAARQVGIIIKELSAAHQVISITHQPQIAAKAQTHFFVYKEIKDDKIVTSIKVLNSDERITNIATMLSGKRPTAAAFENAREMIGN
ncbi:MAG: DNA repair protein RecN [Ginsengibacter sp.]